ncbi:MAG: sigma-54-dependent Fis family transcriptional regulator [Bacteroidetes bacterium]|nr:sigma-54-dependent Fis family transcriptional regulator [Bacteroidota bacterium]
MQKLRILVVDDEARMREEISEYLSKRDYEVMVAADPAEASRLLQKHDFHIAILDIRLPGISGLELLKIIREAHPQIEVIMISGHGDMNSVIEAMRLGAVDYFQKPFRLIDLNQALQRTKRYIELSVRLSQTRHTLDYLSNQFGKHNGSVMIGQSQAIRQVASLMEKVAATDHTSVLITGESGTGKELVALGIHLLSNRKNNLFHSVNCSAVTESLFESEFFGHKKGAFTGATEDRQGWFEVASGGTLFLDEIGDLPLGQQAKLLRALEERKIRRVGSHHEISVDVRIIAASNQPLNEMVANKQFRSDLYHRLSTFIIHLPPLRERPEDIEPIANHFAGHFARSMNKTIHGLNHAALQSLLQYEFPGNIRELRNMIERAVILCDKEWIEPAHLVMRTTGLSHHQVDLTDEILDLEELEKSAIRKALLRSGNNKMAAARLLNISWQALDRRLQKYGLGN